MKPEKLWRFVNSSHSLLVPFQLNNTKLIIDGDGLCGSLYHFMLKSGEKYDDPEHRRQLFGGDYALFGSFVCDFIDKLIECEVVPIVILNANYVEQSKLNQFDRQLEAAVKVSQGIDTSEHDIPWPCVRAVMLQIFEQKCITYRQCTNRDIIPTLARTYKCPILSNNQKYLLLDKLPNGVLEMSAIFESLNKVYAIKRNEAEQNCYLECRIFLFDFEKIEAKFPGLQLEMLQLFSGLIDKTDHLKQELENQFEIVDLECRDPVWIVLKWLSLKSTIESICERFGLILPENADMIQLEQLDLVNLLVVDLFLINNQQILFPRCSIPSEMYFRFIGGEFEPRLLSILNDKLDLLEPLIENYLADRSSFDCTFDLNAYIYGLLAIYCQNDHQKVQKIVRSGTKRVESIVVPKLVTDSGEKLPVLSEIEIDKLNWFYWIIQEACFNSDHHKEVNVNLLREKTFSLVSNKSNRDPLLLMLLSLIMCYHKMAAPPLVSKKWSCFVRAMFTNVVFIGHIRSDGFHQFESQRLAGMSDGFLVLDRDAQEHLHKHLNKLADGRKLPKFSSFDIEITHWYVSWQNCLKALIFWAKLMNLPKDLYNIDRFIIGLQGTFIHKMTAFLVKQKVYDFLENKIFMKRVSKNMEMVYDLFVELKKSF